MKKITVTKETYDQYKEQIIDMEHSCFEGNLLFDDDEIEEMVLAGSNIFLEENNKLIAGTYFQPLNTLSYDDFLDEDYGCQFNLAGYLNVDMNSNPLATYLRNIIHSNAIYINSTAITPEYRSKGIIYQLKDALFDHLRKLDIMYVVGHAHDGKMWHINQKYGAEGLIEYEDWYGQGKHYFYEINLLKQHNDWSCGVYALYYLLKLQKNKNIPTFSQLYKEINPSEEHGTSHDQITDWLDKNEFKYFLNKGLDDNSIINYQYDGDGHYSVLLFEKFTSKDSFCLYNPAIGKNEYIPVETIKENWYSKRYGKEWSLKLV